MKKLLFVLAALFTMAVSAHAQTSMSQQPKKEHVCTQSCHDANKHIYMHGEEGHVCGDACPKSGNKSKPKKHVCTQECHDKGMHVYAHGEKGHVCSDACNSK